MKTIFMQYFWFDLEQVQVTVAGLDGADTVKCSRDVFIKPDVALTDVADKVSWDILK